MSEEDKILLKINKVIDKLRVWIQNDGGDIAFKKLDLKTKTLTIQVSGACIDCDLFDNTFNDNVKKILLKKVKEIKVINFVKK